MCLAIPAKIVQLLDNNLAKVTLGSIEKIVNSTLVAEPQIGDYLLIHAGIALNRIDPREAKKTLELFDSIDIAKPIES